MLSPQERTKLELRAAAQLEIKRRKYVKNNAESVVFGVYDVNPDGPIWEGHKPVLVRCWQHNGSEWVQVDKEPWVTIPLKAERALITPKAIKVLVGGRGSGKSELISKVMNTKMKDQSRKVGCFREFQNSIEDSVHSIMLKNIAHHQFDGFSNTDNKIDHIDGGKTRYRGLARNPEGVKGMDDFSDAWFEEAQTASHKSIELLEPTFRADGAEIWYSMNPASSADPIYLEHVKPYEKQLIRDGYHEDEAILIIQMNYTDNPWFPETMEIKRKKNKIQWGPAKYAHVWEGACNDEVENSIILSEWFDACIDAHLKLGFRPNGVKVASHDVADTGDDDKAYTLRHGSVILDVRAKSDGDGNEGCDWATDLAIEHGADYFTWDCDGMGALLRKQVSDSLTGKKIEQVMYKGSEGVENPNEQYQDVQEENKKEATNKNSLKNKRAQYYSRLMVRCYNTYRAVVKGKYIDPDEMISFSSDIKDMNVLKSEMCRIPKKPNGNGVFQVLSKVEMKKLGIASPNLSDSVMMSLLIPAAKEPIKEINFQGWG